MPVSPPAALATVRTVTDVLDGWYPPAHAESWDAVGTVCGDPDAPVRRVLLAVDPVRAVVDEALEWGADLLVVHHPLLLRAVHSVAATTPKGRVVHDLVRGGVGLHVCHTNADSPVGGVSESMALALGLTGLRPIAPEAAEVGEVGEVGEVAGERGSGRIGRLAEAMPLADFARRVVAALPATASALRIAGDPGRPVQQVAVCGGAGDFLLDRVRSAGVDAYVTSDLRHHPVLELLEHGADDPGTPAVIDVPHMAAEWTWLPRLAARLTAVHTTVEVRVSTVLTDPWTGHLPMSGPAVRQPPGATP